MVEKNNTSQNETSGELHVDPVEKKDDNANTTSTTCGIENNKEISSDPENIAMQQDITNKEAETSGCSGVNDQCEKKDSIEDYVDFQVQPIQSKKRQSDSEIPVAKKPKI